MQVIQEVVGDILRENSDEKDIKWVLLSQALDPSTGDEPIIRKPELQEMVSQGLHSEMLAFRELTLHHLSLQMAFPGSTNYIINLKDFPTIIEALSHQSESISSKASTILSKLDEVLLTPSNETLFRRIANSSDACFIRVYSVLFNAASEHKKLFEAMVHGKWIEQFHNRVSLTEDCDPLILLNLIELEKEFLEAILNASEDLQIIVWQQNQKYSLQLIENLRCDSDKIPFLSLFLWPLLRLLGCHLQLYLQLNKSGGLAIGEYSDFDAQLLSVLEKYSESPEENIQEAVISVIGIFGMTKETRELLLSSSQLVTFYFNSLVHSKVLAFGFIHSMISVLSKSKGEEDGQQFCEKFLGTSQRLEVVLSYGKSPYINEREPVYKLFSELAATRLGRDLLFQTQGLLDWLMDRSQIIESDPEAVWRFSILQQLVAVPEHCKSHIGDHGYLKVREYISDGCFYCPPEHRVAIATEFD